MLEGRPHVVLASSAQLVQLEVLDLPLVLHLALGQTVLSPQLLDLTLHLSVQTLILEVLHLQSLLELVDLKVHQTPPVILRSPDLVDLLDHLPLVPLLLPPEFISLLEFELVALVVQTGDLAQ